MLICLIFLNILLLFYCKNCINAGKLSKYSSRQFNMTLQESQNFELAVFVDAKEFSSHKYLYFKVILHDGEFINSFVYYGNEYQMSTRVNLDHTEEYDGSSSNIRTYKILKPTETQNYLFITPPAFSGTSIEIQNYYRLSAFEILGIVLGILAFLLIILIVGCYYYKRSKNLALVENENNNDKVNDNDNDNEKFINYPRNNNV